MEAARRGGFGGLLPRNPVPGDGAFTNLVLFAYVLLATLIAGAASAGAGLAILVMGLLTLLTLDFVRWRNDEVKAGMRTGWEALEASARRALPRPPAPPEGRPEALPASPDPRARPQGGPETRAPGARASANDDAGNRVLADEASAAPRA